MVRRFQELFEEAEQEGNAEIEDGDDNENKVTSPRIPRCALSLDPAVAGQQMAACTYALRFLVLASTPLSSPLSKAVES